MKLTQNGSCFFDIDIFDWLTNNPDFDETNTKRGSCCFLALPCVVFVLFCLVLLCFVFLSCIFLACVILCCCRGWDAQLDFPCAIEDGGAFVAYRSSKSSFVASSEEVARFALSCLAFSCVMLSVLCCVVLCCVVLC